MTSGVPWQMKGVRREVIETAREAARRSGMSVAEWLDSVIAESARNAGVDPIQRIGCRPRRLQRESTDHDRRRRITRLRRPRAEDHFRRQRAPRHARQRATTDAGAPPRTRVDSPPIRTPAHRPRPSRRSPRSTARLERRSTGAAGARSTARRRPTAAAPDAPPARSTRRWPRSKRASARWTAKPRRRAWTLPARRPSACPTSSSSCARSTPASKPCGPAASTMRSRRLRDDLAEIGVMLKEAMPRQAIEALESEVRVARRAHRQQAPRRRRRRRRWRGIERGLAEVRDALHALTPAENLAGFDETRAGPVAEDRPHRQHRPGSGALKQLEGAIVALRGVVSHVASDDALATLVRRGARAFRQGRPGHAASDAFSAIEQRIAAIADALQSAHSGVPAGDTRRPRSGGERASPTRSSSCTPAAPTRPRSASGRPHRRLVEKLDAPMPASITSTRSSAGSPTC